VASGEHDDVVDIVVATANVNTLLDAKRSKCALHKQAMGRVHLMKMSIPKAGIHIVGIQEGRIQTDQQRSGFLYEQYISGANQAGSYGSQLWALRSGPFEVTSFIPHSPRLVGIMEVPKRASRAFVCSVVTPRLRLIRSRTKIALGTCLPAECVTLAV